MIYNFYDLFIYLFLLFFKMLPVLCRHSRSRGPHIRFGKGFMSDGNESAGSDRWTTLGHISMISKILHC